MWLVDCSIQYSKWRRGCTISNWSDSKRFVSVFHWNTTIQPRLHQIDPNRLLGTTEKRLSSSFKWEDSILRGAGGILPSIPGDVFKELDTGQESETHSSTSPRRQSSSIGQCSQIEDYTPLLCHQVAPEGHPHRYRRSSAGSFQIHFLRYLSGDRDRRLRRYGQIPRRVGWEDPIKYSGKSKIIFKCWAFVNLFLFITGFATNAVWRCFCSQHFQKSQNQRQPPYFPAQLQVLRQNTQEVSERGLLTSF